MWIKKQVVPSNFELVLFGDNQEGNRLSYIPGFLKVIDYIAASKNVYALHMGDEVEAIWIKDPRYSPIIHKITPENQRKNVVNYLKPIKNKLITILFGNHSKILYDTNGDITRSICEELGIGYAKEDCGGYSCVVSFCDKKGEMFKGYFTHGKKPIRSIADDPIRNLANQKLQLKQHLKHKFSDCILMAKGHTHKLIVSEPVNQLFLTTENDHITEHYTGYVGGNYIHPDHRWYVNTGSFLKTSEEGVLSYSEYFEYDPVELGYAVVEVHDRQITGIRKVVV